MQLIGDELASLDVPFELTRRGAMLIELPGKRDPDRAVVVHADTIRAMVRAIRPDGRLDLVPIATWSARFAEGGRVTVFTEEPDGILTGTAHHCQASGQAFHADITDTQDHPAQ